MRIAHKGTPSSLLPVREASRTIYILSKGLVFDSRTQVFNYRVTESGCWFKKALLKIELFHIITASTAEALALFLSLG